MSSADLTEMNAPQRAYWNGAGAADWRQHGDRWETMDGPFGAAMLRAAQLHAGDRVLDVGCGAGATTVEAAHQVGPTGTVVGVDISAVMLEFAATRIREAGVTNIELLEADAQVHRFGEGVFDAVISRGGTMFFADPVVAFGNLARSLRPGGRLAMVVSRGPLDNEWITTAWTALAPYVDGVDLEVTDRPQLVGWLEGLSGPSAFADGKRLDHILAATGFRAVDRQELTLPVRIGTDADDVTGYLLAQPEAHALLEGRSAGQVSGAIAAVRDAYAPHAGPDGVVMSASGWLVTAQH
jgi:SAM-dependent methyltransferase